MYVTLVIEALGPTFSAVAKMKPSFHTPGRALDLQNLIVQVELVALELRYP